MAFPFCSAESDSHLLWSDRPVTIKESQKDNLRELDKVWSQEIYPIGNGRLGCAVFGVPALERIQFNEDSLWVGNEDHTGGYQPFGDLYIQFPGHDTYENYCRELDISRAVQRVKYQSGGVSYTREYIASYPDQVLAIRLTAERVTGPFWNSGHNSLGMTLPIGISPPRRSVPVFCSTKSLPLM